MGVFQVPSGSKFNTCTNIDEEMDVIQGVIASCGLLVDKTFEPEYEWKHKY